MHFDALKRKKKKSPKIDNYFNGPYSTTNYFFSSLNIYIHLAKLSSNIQIHPFLGAAKLTFLFNRTRRFHVSFSMTKVQKVEIFIND